MGLYSRRLILELMGHLSGLDGHAMGVDQISRSHIDDVSEINHMNRRSSTKLETFKWSPMVLENNFF